MKQGGSHSKATRRKMSESAKRRKLLGLVYHPTSEVRERIAATLKGNQNAAGHVLSPEARQKIAKSNTGRVHTELSRKHMGDSHKGFVFSAESRKKMSESARRVPLSKRRRGWKHSVDSKRKMSKALKGRKFSEERCRKMSLAMKGKGFPLACRQKAIAAITGKPRSAEVKQKISKANKGRTLSKAWCKKIAKAHIGLSPSAEARKKIGIKHKELWAKISLEGRQDRTHAGRKAVCHSSPTKLEKTMHQHLRKAGVRFQSQKSFRPYFVDIFIPSLNMVVECDGAYWHNTQKARVSDHKRDRYLISRYGVRVVRVPEKSIRGNPKLAVSTILGARKSI